MDGAQLNQTSARKSPRKGSWTPRIILWTLACGVGLWLGTGTRTSAAGGQTSRPSTTAQTAIADIFRFDILLAGKEPSAQPVQSTKVPEEPRKLPMAVLVAMQQRPDPVPSVMPKTLSCTRPRFMITPPGRPGRPVSMHLDGNMALLEQTQARLQALLATVQGLTADDRKSIQSEVDKACAQIGNLRAEPLPLVSEPSEPTMGLPSADLPHTWPDTRPDTWPEPGTQLRP
jgi:hypothetical protein